MGAAEEMSRPPQTTEPHGTDPAASGFQQRIVALVGETLRGDIRKHETLPTERVLVELLPQVLEKLHAGTALARDVLERFDGASDDAVGIDEPMRPEQTGEFYLGVDGLVFDGANHSRVADLAFIASTELWQKLRRVEALHEGMERWDVVGELGSGLRRVIKTFTALEHVLAEEEGLEPELGFESQLETSLEVRRQYTRLRRSIAGDGTPESEQALVARLRGIGTRIAMLIGREVYTELRIGDRIEIRKLQARILAWLRDPQVAVGHRLLQDLVGFGDLLAQVSRRQELVEHDHAALREALEASTGTLMPADQLIALQRLDGLDPELDALIATEERRAPRWRPVLERLLGQLGVGPGGASW